MSRITVPEPGIVQVQISDEELKQLLIDHALKKAEQACFEIEAPFPVHLPIVSLVVKLGARAETNTMEAAYERPNLQVPLEEWK
jgi:hypothetical protein